MECASFITGKLRTRKQLLFGNCRETFPFHSTMTYCQVNYMTSMLPILIPPLQTQQHTSILRIHSSAQKPSLAPHLLTNSRPSFSAQCTTWLWLRLHTHICLPQPLRTGVAPPLSIFHPSHLSFEAQPKLAAPLARSPPSLPAHSSAAPVPSPLGFAHRLPSLNVTPPPTSGAHHYRAIEGFLGL